MGEVEGSLAMKSMSLGVTGKFVAFSILRVANRQWRNNKEMNMIWG